MSKENNSIVSAISLLSAALAEAGLTGVSITVSAANIHQTAETNVTETKTDTGRRGRGAAADDAAKEETKADAATNKAADAKPTGRGRGRGAAAEENADAASEDKPAGRGRGRSAKKEVLINDTPEQAEMRERLVADLLTLADHDEAIDDVTEALQRTGATNIKEVGSDQLESLDADIGIIFDKYGI